MSTVPDLLLITWNRSSYLEKTIETLFSAKSDFRLYWWDNASDGLTRELHESLSDDRIAMRYRSNENVGQFEPFHWFMDNATGDVLGKIDDDILLPEGWIEQIGPMVQSDPRLGMLGCWIFMETDWDGTAAELNTTETAAGPVWQMTCVAGHSFLMHRRIADRFLMHSPFGHGIPLDRIQMALEGIISGIPIPPLFAHNMDDPRSPYCVGADDEGQLSALTGRSLGFANAEQYSSWIAEDASTRLRVPYARQVRRLRLSQSHGIVARGKRALLKAVNAW